jgi:CheY-like chemotaxis protein
MPKILIADDEVNIRLLLQMTLERLNDAGVELLVAENGVEALRQIRAHKPELVFLDVMMPEMSGYEVCSMVKKTNPVPGVAIILLTAKGQDADYQAGMNAGADQYLTKPFDPDVLLVTAKKILGLSD